MPPRRPLSAPTARKLAGALVLALAVAMLLAVGAYGEGALTAPPAPANDSLANAQTIHSLPASINGTTVSATTEASEPTSACGGPTGPSVWYSLRLTGAQRVGIDLAASGTLDAVVDVYHAVRSQLTSVGCQQTDSEGKASLSFKAAKNGLYEIKVAALQNSQLAPFTLEVFQPTPAVQPPGAPLPSAGVSGRVDRVQNVNAAYSVTLHAGVSYLISLANETEHACVSGSLFAPGTSSFGEEEGEGEGGGNGALVHIQCGGYRLFTPGAGQGGRYSFEITPRFSHRGIQRFHLQIASAGPAETAPGLALPNDAVAHGYLSGRSVRVLRLYRMEVTSHSNLTLKLRAPDSAEFKLQLRSQSGHVIECDCEGSGSQTLTHQLRPGTYYAIVAVRNGSSGSFSLERESRTITATSISFSNAKAAAGESLSIDVKVTPAQSGPVSVDIERFDPVFGWQFYREVRASVSGGLASVPFTPPAVGSWRAKASYEGSRTASPSAVGFTYLLVS
ncbi:MAG TPA: hypothetical protein VK790_01350 [Solirubrobacteraceae bacterium]|jgi:hypothetical protein|nr:hypothetical protein [Solirubrobacteraceae bacterium]